MLLPDLFGYWFETVGYQPCCWPLSVYALRGC